MKFIVNMLRKIFIIIFILNKNFSYSSYLKNSDLYINIPDNFKSKFHNEEDFNIFLKNIVQRTKIRILERLFDSLKIRNEIKNNIKQIDIKINAINANNYININNNKAFNEFNSNLENFLLFEKIKENNKIQNINGNITINNIDYMRNNNNNFSEENFIKNLMTKKKENTPFNYPIDNPSNSPFNFLSDFSHIFFNSDKKFQIEIIGEKIINYLQTNSINTQTKSDNNKINIYSKNHNEINENLNTKFLHNFENFIKEIKKENKISKINLKEEDNFNTIKNKVNSFTKFVKKKKILLKNGKLKSNFTNINNEFDLFNSKEVEKTLRNKENNNYNIDAKSKVNNYFDIDDIDNMLNYNVDNNPLIKKRVVNMYIKKSNPCNIYIKDELIFNNDINDNNNNLNVMNEYTNFMYEHIIANNNKNLISPKGINYKYNNNLNDMNNKNNSIEESETEGDLELEKNKENTGEINYFIFNRKLNMFTLNIQKPRNSYRINTNNKNNFSLIFEYNAENFITSSYDNRISFLKKRTTEKNENENENENKNKSKNKNKFKWEIYNQNIKEIINTEINIFFYFDIDIEKEKETQNQNKKEKENFYFDFAEIQINSEQKFEKLKDEKNNTYFSIKKDLLPYEVFTIDTSFPLIFKNCKANLLSFSTIFFLSGFVILVIIAIYLILSNIIKDFL
jgi:hypothetical protein